MNRSEKNSHWERHMTLWRQSGLSQKSYCEQNGISYWSFKNWAGKLKSKNEKPSKGLVRIDVKSGARHFSGKIEIHFGKCARIFVDGEIDPARLADLINALETRCD